MDLTQTLPAIRTAQASWAALSVQDRASHLKQIGKRFAARGADIVSIVCEETKKSSGDAWFADVVPNLDLFDWWTGGGLAAIKPRKAPISKLKFPKKRARLIFEPKGIVGVISPWNYPAALPMRSIIPALMAGNAVIFKPSEVTPKTGALLAEIFNQVLPGGVLTVVQGAGEAGEAVVDASDHVIFTGSVATGKKVAARCAEQLKSASLELGGKDAAIVLADCDFARTVQGVFWGAMSNSGQNCAAIERVYVEQSIYEPFVAALVDAAKKASVAPVATEAQDQIVRGQLEDAVQKGATLHGEYPGPVILTDLPDDAIALTEETFGPIVGVVPIANAEEGLRKANASRYGLTTSIWTKNTTKAEELAARASSGTVTINNCAFTGAMPFAPWSGRRESGHGVTNSHLAILEMVAPKFVLIDDNTDPEAWWFPLSEQANGLAQTTLAWLTASGFSKLGKTFGVLGGMKKRIAEQKNWFRGDGG